MKVTTSFTFHAYFCKKANPCAPLCCSFFCFSLNLGHIVPCSFLFTLKFQTERKKTNKKYRSIWSMCGGDIFMP